MKIDKALEQYEKTFDDSFPMFTFMGTSESDVIEMINKCISENKDVYEMGYLSLDTVY